MGGVGGGGDLRGERRGERQGDKQSGEVEVDARGEVRVGGVCGEGGGGEAWGG